MVYALNGISSSLPSTQKLGSYSTFLTIPSLKTRARHKTTQSLTRSIPSLSSGRTQALRQSLVLVLNIRLRLIFGLVLAVPPSLPTARTFLAAPRISGEAWHTFQLASSSTRLPATHLLLVSYFHHRLASRCLARPVASARPLRLATSIHRIITSGLVA